LEISTRAYFLVVLAFVVLLVFVAPVDWVSAFFVSSFSGSGFLAAPMGQTGVPRLMWTVE
jgi:hypothetical protein